MLHAIYKLKFSTATRFGSDDGGGNLTGASMTFRADVLFSALFRALLPLGEDGELLRFVRDGSLAFSDALPWRGGTLFLPRPVGIFAKPDERTSGDPSQRKLLKKIAYIPADGLAQFMAGQADLRELYEMNHFGSAFEETRVNLRDGDQPMPYQVGGFRFSDDSGLYLVARGEQSALTLFEAGLRCLSAEGIGGEISSGWGKFTFESTSVPADWVRALEDENAARYMTLSTALPSEDEMTLALEGAYYTVVRRGGFVSSVQTQPFKKQTVFLLGAGSTFRHRFHGTVLDVGIEMPHPVWRYAVPLFMGVNA